MPLSVLKPFVLCVDGSSLAYGRLAAPPVGWVERLARELPLQPEAVGPIAVYPRGHGGWTSADILADAPVVAGLRPTHILTEAGDINDCVDFGAGPAITRAQKITNMQAMIAAWQAAIPGVDITFQTMNPVSAAGAAIRPTLADYYADTLAQAAVSAVGALNNYAAWPSPLPEWMTNGFDGLHPVWANAAEVYLYRAVLFLMRQKMASFWSLGAPAAPVYPTGPDIDFLLIAGAGGGGDQVGGGGGCGGILRGRDYAAALLGAFAIGAAGVAAGGQPGTSGADTVVGSYRAIGGGGGGFYSADLTLSRGRDGASSGGGGTFASPHAPGTPRVGQGFQGGKAAPGSNDGAGAGGSCTGPGGDGATDGGAPSPGWTTDVPGDPQPVCGGGPGGSFNGHRPAYGLGGGPTRFGGGGRGGGDFGATGAGDNGGIGKAWIWYPGAARFAGGVITASGGFTVHALTGTGTLV